MIFGTTNRNRLSRFAEEIPSELLATVQPLFYMDAIDAAKKALDIY